ncbi:FHA domain-containing protein [Flectobacillus major]|uniref:FHA domain-containing protein n=1 Tax=Flectobacillus major TaxID=103 RepID=UPI0004091A9D|nr:FHA domain-containing protein [Flectobacillus major]
MILITIGRGSNNQIIINNAHVSGNHAELSIDDFGNITLTDRSQNGTTVNGRNIHNTSTSVKRGDRILFANIIHLDWNQVPISLVNNGNFKHIITVGKNTDNIIQVYNDNISRYHATIKIDKKGNVFINDQSSNGTFVNGSRVSKYTDFPVKRGDKVSFANVQDLDWKQIPKSSISPIYYILPICLAILSGVTYYEYFVKTDVSKKYENSIGLIYNSYYLAYIDDKDTLYYIGADDVVDMKNNPKSKESLRPIEITGSGFYVSEDGNIITNKHVVSPWDSELAIDKEEIEKRINIIRAMKGEASKNSHVEGVIVKLGIFPNGSSLNKSDPLKNMLPCKLVKLASEKELDLALIQLDTKKTPSNCTPVTDIIKGKEQISLDDEVSIFGYPFGLDLALKNSESRIKASFDHGKISKISDKYEIQYNAPSFHGASGSPVFNQKGQLIAVNYAGMEKAQGYNFGIIATHINKLLDF